MIIDEWFRRAWYLLNRTRRDGELQREMQAHLEMMQDPARFGSTLRLREEARDAWGFTWIDDLYRDIKYSARTAKANPVFTAAVVLTLALGIGANTAVFSVMNVVALRVLPVPNPEQIVYLKTTGFPDGAGNTGDATSSFSLPVFEALRTHNS